MPVYLPNPGRLRELLLPGRTVYLTKNSNPGKFSHTAVAVERNDRPVLLHTHLANGVVEWLLREKAVPGFEGDSIERREVSVGHSRFDFLLRRKGEPFLLEVKSCTLFEDSIAMFPDAVTVRGRRHLLKLAEEADHGRAGGVIILINAPGIRWFLPDYHTDLEFSRTMLALRKTISFTPLSITWERDLSTSTPVEEAVIPWNLLEREARDSGSYIIIMRLDEERLIEVGRLGVHSFPKGYYLYVGSAKTGLTKRIERHRRKRKHFHRHMDYLRNEADALWALPIRSSDDLECDIAAALGRIARQPVPDFGSSDCSCKSHLFAMAEDPIRNVSFIEILQYFRMGRIRSILENGHREQG